MSFVDALPGFRMKQWQVVVLLFVDALSVCRIPVLISYMTDRRDLFLKVRPFVFFWVQSETVYTDLLFYTHDMKLGIWLLREAFYNDIRLHRYPDENTWSLLYWKWCSAYKLSVLFDGLQNFVYDKYRDINHILWFLKFVLSYSKFDLLTVVLVLVWWSRFWVVHK
jgi:hypothetical protein